MLNVKDYFTRLRDLQRFALEQYGVRPEDIAALCALTLRSPYPGCWVIVESSGHHFWDHWTEAMWAKGMKFGILTARSLKPFHANNYVEAVLKERRTTHFWLDVYGEELWKRNSPFKNSRYGELEAECVRLRVPVRPRICPPNSAVLRELTNKVWDFEHRRTVPGVMAQSSTFTAYVQALQALNPMLTNQRALIDNLCTLPNRNAALYGRGEDAIEPQDHKLTLRVMRDSIRKWTFDLLEPLIGGNECEIGDFLCALPHLKMDTVRALLEELEESGVLTVKTKRRTKMWIWSVEWGPDCESLLVGDARWWREE